VPKVFISYKHNAEPDARLVGATVARLRQAGHDVFIDSQIKVGDEWPTVIKENVSTSDYLIVFLSAAAAASEMVIEEVKIARLVSKEKGRPKILPVRVAHDEALPYDLGAWLDRLQQAHWQSAADDSTILDQLIAAIEGGDLPSKPRVPENRSVAATDPLPAFDPRWLESLDGGAGAVTLANPFYIERDLDLKAKKAITKAGQTILIRGSRQSGKTSALARICQREKEWPTNSVYRFAGCGPVQTPEFGHPVAIFGGRYFSQTEDLGKPGSVLGDGTRTHR
jgi:hypothetical protein